MKHVDISPSEFKQADMEFHRHTARQYEDTIAREYHMYHVHSLYPWIERLYAANPAMRVLDIGCGTGIVSLILARKGFQVVGIDHSIDMLEIARHKAASLNLSGRITFIQSDIEKISFEDNSFDGITCQGVLHHLRDMRPVLAEAYRVLKPGGHFYISEPCNPPTFIKLLFLSIQKMLGRIKTSSRSQPEAVESHEAPISSYILFDMLDSIGFQFKHEFMVHMPLTYRIMPDGLRLWITRLISYPWRHSKGDILFLECLKQR
jgi:ubiquinone/menaquinone biosynthesis C-methylase UbiE